MEKSLTGKELDLIHAWWRACNYLAVGMIYLQDNPLLRKPLKVDHVKHRLLGHWGASPALSFVWTHLNRMIVRHDLDVVYVAGPGHGAPGVLGPAYLEGTYSEIYPDKSEDEEGMRSSSSSSPFPATSAVTSRRRPRARFTRSASSATASRMPTAWLSTTRS